MTGFVHIQLYHLLEMMKEPSFKAYVTIISPVVPFKYPSSSIYIRGIVITVAKNFVFPSVFAVFQHISLDSFLYQFVQDDCSNIAT